MTRRLKTVQIMVNKKCNSHCSFCSIWQNQDVVIPTMDDYKKLIDMGITEFNLTGGEPFLTDITPILDYLKDKARLVISTNGFLTDKILEVMKQYKDYKNIAVRVSIDGNKSGTHDKIRGTPGAWVNATNTVKQLKELGIHDLGISFTICQDNLTEVYDSYLMAKYFGVQFVLTTAFNSTVYFQKSDNELNDYATVPEQITKIQRDYLKGWNIKEWGRAYFLEFVKQHTLGKPIHFKCGAFSEFLFVNQQGRMFPCVVGGPDCGCSGDLGHIQDIEKVWNSDMAEQTRKSVANCKKGCLMCNFTSYIKEHKMQVLMWVLKKKFGGLK